MKLTRWTPIVMGRGDYADCVIDPYGQYYRVAKVDAMLASIRAAVEAEREAAPPWQWDDCYFLGPRDVGEGGRLLADARAALDALLAPSPAVPPQQDDRETARDE